MKKLGDQVRTYKMDGRTFIKTIVADDLSTVEHTTAPLVAMNLPALAIDFLDAFRGILKDKTTEDHKIKVYYRIFFITNNFHVETFTFPLITISIVLHNNLWDFILTINKRFLLTDAGGILLLFRNS